MSRHSRTDHQARRRRRAVCDIGGIEKTVNVSLIERPVPGDWVIVHVGFALNRIDPEEAQRTLAALKAAGLHDEEHAS